MDSAMVSLTSTHAGKQETQHGHPRENKSTWPSSTAVPWVPLKPSMVAQAKDISMVSHGSASHSYPESPHQPQNPQTFYGFRQQHRPWLPGWPSGIY